MGSYLDCMRSPFYHGPSTVYAPLFSHLVCPGRQSNKKFSTSEEDVSTVHQPRVLHLYHFEAKRTGCFSQCYNLSSSGGMTCKMASNDKETKGIKARKGERERASVCVWMDVQLSKHWLI